MVVIDRAEWIRFSNSIRQEYNGYHEGLQQLGVIDWMWSTPNHVDRVITLFFENPTDEIVFRLKYS